MGSKEVLNERLWHYSAILGNVTVNFDEMFVKRLRAQRGFVCEPATVCCTACCVFMMFILHHIIHSFDMFH